MKRHSTATRAMRYHVRTLLIDPPMIRVTIRDLLWLTVVVA